MKWFLSLYTNLTATTVSAESFRETIAKVNSQGIIGLVTSLPKAIVGLIALRAEMGKGAFAALGLDTALEMLNINPAMLALSALAITAGIVFGAFELFAVTVQKADEQLQTTKDNIVNLTSELENLESELKTTNERISELENKDSLTLVEQTELDKLYETNAELERQIALKEKQKEVESRKISSDLVQSVSTYKDEHNWEFVDPTAPITLDLSRSTSNQDKFEYDLARYQQERLAYDKAIADGDTEAAQKHQEAMDAVDAKMLEYTSHMRGYIEDLGVDYNSLSDDAKKSYDEILDAENRYLMLIGDRENVIKGIFNSDKYKDANEALKELGKNGKATAKDVKELSDTNESVKDMVNYMQQLGLVNLSNDNVWQQLANQFNEVQNIANETTDSIANNVKSLEDITKSIDEIQEAYNLATSVIKDYNENGFLSIDNLQSLVKLSDKYIDVLIDENGVLNLNEDAYRKLMDAELDELELRQVRDVLDNLSNMSKEAAQAYINAEATDKQTESVENLIQAMLQEAAIEAKRKDIAEGTNVYTQALEASIPTIAKRIALIEQSRSAVDNHTKATQKSAEAEKKANEERKKALEDERKYLQKQQDGLKDAQKALSDYIDLVIDMITKQKQLEKEALEEQKKNIDELIDARKKLLQAEEKEYEFYKEVYEKQQSVAKNALSVAILSLDDSSAGKKAYKTANDELISSRNDIQEYLTKHEYEVREEALDNLKELTDKHYDEQIETIDKYLDDERQIYLDACDLIDNDTGQLFGQLLAYARKYTTKTDSEIRNLWSDAQEALGKYNSQYQPLFSLMDTLNGKIHDNDREIDLLGDKIDDLSQAIDNTATSIETVGSALGTTLADGIEDAQIELQKYKDVLDSLHNSVKLKGYSIEYNNSTYDSNSTNTEQAAKDIAYKIYRDKKNKLTQEIPWASLMSRLIPKYASGTKSAIGGLSLVGEQGAEMRVLNKGDGILTANITKNLMAIGQNPKAFLSNAYANFISSLADNSAIAESLARMYDNGLTKMNIPQANTTNTVSPVINLTIQGDATQSTVKALQKEANNIIDKATKNMMNIALRNRHII